MNIDANHLILELTREIQTLAKTDSAICIILQLDAIRDKFTQAEWNALMNVIYTRYAANNSTEQL